MILNMDAGPILEIVKVPINEGMTLEDLEHALYRLSAPTLFRVLDRLKRGALQKQAQNHNEATFAEKILLKDRIIDWSRPAHDVCNQIRGLSPLPGAFTFVEVVGLKKRLGIKRAQIRNDFSGDPSSTLLSTPDEWVVACGEGAISLLHVQLEGKKVLDIKSFFRGHVVPPVIKVD
jgi:methionyl-tRNA formyltransferase